MELVAYIVAVVAASIGSFWFAGSIYGLIHKPSLYFPVSLATKMALCAVFGSFFLMIGGPILSTMVFNAEMARRPDYKKWPVIISGVIISLLCTVFIYFSIIGLAWQILD